MIRRGANCEASRRTLRRARSSSWAEVSKEAVDTTFTHDTRRSDAEAAREILEAITMNTTSHAFNDVLQNSVWICPGVGFVNDVPEPRSVQQIVDFSGAEIMKDFFDVINFQSNTHCRK